MPDTTNPSGINKQDKRRFRVVPLKKENIDKAGIGEFVVDRETGDIYVIDETGTPISRTSSLENSITKNIFNNLNSLSYMYNRNRRVYRLFFIEDRVRLDANLILDEESYYYRIRQLDDASAPYIISDLTKVGTEGTVNSSSTGFKENSMYYVEFYNASGELISMLPFLAKKVMMFDSTGSIENVVKGISIHTNMNKMYLGQSKESLLIRVMAEYYSGSSLQRDITDSNQLSIIDDIDVTKEGIYNITATWVYDLTNNTSTSITKTIEVVSLKESTIERLVVIPRKVNSNYTMFYLTAFVYYEDGTFVDVTNDIVFSDYDNLLFDKEQTVVASLYNDNKDCIYQETFTVKMNSDNTSSDKIIYFQDGMVSIDEKDVPTSEDIKYYKVRRVSSSGDYYTPSFIKNGEDGAYSYIDESDIQDNEVVIVEFYNEYKFLELSYVFTAKYGIPATDEENTSEDE